MNNYPVIEIFHSIQGEGCNMGKPVTFVRLAGCNLSCPWCDTKESLTLQKAVFMSIEEIVNRCVFNTVVITGGEPTIHPLENLASALKKVNKYVALETNGTNSIKGEHFFDWITVSPKPQSGFVINCRANELKYVIDSKFKSDVISKVHDCPIWLQPESDKPESRKEAYSLAMSSEKWRMGIQLHKILEVR